MEASPCYILVDPLKLPGLELNRSLARWKRLTTYHRRDGHEGVVEAQESAT